MPSDLPLPTHHSPLTSVTIGLVQMRCDPQPEVNMTHATERIRQSAAKGAQIICLPELFRSPYFCQREDPINFNLAEPIPGPSTERLGQVARETGAIIIASLFERRAAGVYHNTAAVIDADGRLLGIFRKMHIPDDPLYFEKYYFTPGDASSQGSGVRGQGSEVRGQDPQPGLLSSPLPTPHSPLPTSGFRAFDTCFGRIGVLVCWDQWYPEAARLTALHGAQILFYPTAIGWHPREKAEFGADQHQAWEMIQRSHGIANGVYVAAANRVGLENEGRGNRDQGRGASFSSPLTPDPSPLAPITEGNGLEFWGASFVSDPFGRLLHRADHQKEENVIVTCDLKRLEETRRNWPFLRDRRIDAYGDITRRLID